MYFTQHKVCTRILTAALTQALTTVLDVVHSVHFSDYHCAAKVANTQAPHIPPVLLACLHTEILEPQQGDRHALVCIAVRD